MLGCEEGNIWKYSRCLEGNKHFGKLLLSFVPQYKLNADKGVSSSEMKMIDDIMIAKNNCIASLCKKSQQFIPF